MKRRRIVVTGLGVVSPHGNEPLPVFQALCAGHSALAFDDGFDTVVGRAAPDDSPHAPPARQSGADRVSRLALTAGRAALADAGWRADASPWPSERVGIHVGTGFGGTAAVSEAYRRFHDDERIPPLSVVCGMANAPAAHLAIATGFAGPVLTYSVACASSSIAIAAGARDVVCGDVDAVLVGGCEAPLVASMVASWQAMHTLAAPRPDAASASCRPFSATRSGLVLAEGAAFLVLEELDAAVRRGARIYAELAGSGTSCDAMHLTKPQADGQVRAMSSALRQAGLSPDRVGYCNAHGTATLVGDTVESTSIRTLWGDDLGSLRVSSTKSMHGHLLGAAGALEALVATLAVHTNRLPPNAHCEDPDRECRLPLVAPGETPARPIEAAITNSFAFGGTNSSLVLTRSP